MKFKFVFFALFFIIPSTLFAGSKKTNLMDKKIDPMGETWCGQLNQQKCGPSTKEYWEMGGCDYGLKSKWSWSEWKSYCRMGSRKSASIPSWLSKTLQFQRSLSKDLHINKTVSIGAHNTQAPKETSGSLLLLQGNIQPNQKYSITDLLDMGVRRLSIDVHNFNRTIRVCHGNMSHIGCSPRARYWAAWIEELKKWIDDPNNKNEIVILQIENWLDGNVEDFVKPVNAYLKSLALKTSDKPRHNWPTQQWLINNKKRLILFVQNDIDKLNQLSGNIFFKQGHYFHPGWPGNYAESFYGLQGNCRVANHGGLANDSREQNTQHWRVISEDRSFLTQLLEVFNKTFTDNKGHKTIDNNMIKEITTCNISGWEMDFAVPERMNHAVWTWETGHPYNWGKGSDCALMKGADGRWISSNCNGKAYYACVNKNDPYNWKLSDEKGSWDEGDIRCKKLGNYKLGLPLNGYQNNLVNKERVNEDDHVWIKYSKGQTQRTSLNSSSSKKNASALFSPGFYKIKNELSKKYLTYLWRNYTIQYSNLKFSSYWNKRQIWEIINIKADLYQIKNSVTSRCLEANHNRNGAITYAEKCRAKNDQLWKIKNMGSGRYQVINSAFSNCMDIQGSTRYKYRNWLRPMTWKCYNVRQHKFIFEAER